MPQILRRSIRIKDRLRKRLGITHEKRARATITQLAESNYDYVPLEPCKYKYRGCKRTLSEIEKQVHENECRWRWYKCEGKIFANWDCNWKGYHENILNHFKKVHPGYTYLKPKNKIETKIYFKTNELELQLIKRQKQLFWYKYKLIPDRNIGYWLCQYVGPQDEASTFYYEFIMSAGFRSVAVKEFCFTDAKPADDIANDGRCILMTFDQIKNFQNEEKSVHITFKIMKKVNKKS